MCTSMHVFCVYLCLSTCTKQKKIKNHKKSHCRKKEDYAFVSRAYADVCSCPTNVTSHNPEKLHQSHLIMHIHDAALHSAGSTSVASHRAEGYDWVKSFQFTDPVRLRHEHQRDNTTSMPIYFMIWDYYGKRVFLLFLAFSHIPTACSVFNPCGNFL